MKKTTYSTSPRLPSQLLIVSASGRMDPVPGSGYDLDETLSLACVLTCRREGDRLTRPVLHFCDSADAFQDIVKQHASSRRVLHIFGHRLSRILQLTRFWAEVRRGAYRFGRAKIPCVSDTAKSGGKGGGWLGTVMLGDPPTHLRFRSHVGVIEATDCRNYLRTAHEELPCVCGVKKHAMPPEAGKLDQEAAQLIREARAVLAFIWGILIVWRAGAYGPWRPTAAGLAWQAFTHRLSVCRYWRPADDAVKLTERAAFYPGRSEAYWTGKVRFRDPPADEYYPDPEENPTHFITGPVYLVDIRSAYGWAMATESSPVSYEGRLDSPSVSAVSDRLSKLGGVAVCRISSDTEPYPCRRAMETRECVGQFWTVLAGRELSYALNRGHITEVSECHLYRLGRPLARYAVHWLSLRAKAEAEGDTAGVYTAKMMTNSLFGRHAILSPRWKLDPSLPVLADWGPYVLADLERRTAVGCRSLGSVAERRYGISEPPESWPAVAAFIAAAVRCRLRALLATAGTGQVLLVRTDSLLLRETGYRALVAAGEINSQPGGLRLVEGPTCDCVIRSADHYAIGSTSVQVGVGKRATLSEGGWLEVYRRERAECCLARPPGSPLRVTRIAVPPNPPVPLDRSPGWGWHEAIRLTAVGQESPPPSALMLGQRASDLAGPDRQQR